jgi:hypothetical protein
MKKLIALIAIVVLTTSFAFATNVTNNATVNVKCKPMEFTCHGPISMDDLLADGVAIVHGQTVWTITNWGTTGTFTCSYATPPPNFIKVTPPTGGLATDLTVTGVGGTLGSGFSISANLTGTGTYTFTPLNCNVSGTFMYDFDVTAAPGSVSGLYTIAFTLDFTTP